MSSYCEWGSRGFPECGDKPDVVGMCMPCRNVLRWRLDKLAHNLAIGAALCRAFELGGKYADDLWAVDDLDWPSERREARAKLWRPGCGRQAP